jgi:hypothetical protein
MRAVDDADHGAFSADQFADAFRGSRGIALERVDSDFLFVHRGARGTSWSRSRIVE